MHANPVYVEAYVVDERKPPATAPSYPASAAAPVLSNKINETGAREFLSSQNWPVGLQDTLIRNLFKIPIRFFICDDSGSMCASDGHKLYGSDPRAMKMIGCSRWGELATALSFHSSLAFHANALTQFRLLNGAADISIGNNFDPENSAKFRMFQALLEASPSGGTPLCHHMREVIAQIRILEPTLRALNQKACVVILTDGESSDGDLAATMQALRTLPVWTVIRLCTDEEKVVDYWNNIDSQLELDMDVLDDLCGEAQEVHAINPWLVYGEPLHRLREFGIPVKEIDLLDEAKLTLDQARNVAALM
jgi:hypothetical protein